MRTRCARQSGAAHWVRNDARNLKKNAEGNMAQVLAKQLSLDMSSENCVARRCVL